MAVNKVKPKSPGQPGPDALTDKWSAWLSLRWGLDLAGWDARVATLPAGAQKTALRHRSGLLEALEAREDERIADKLELMLRTTTMAAAKPVMVAGKALVEGRKKPRRGEINEWIARQLARDPGAKSPALWARAPDFVTDQIGDRAFSARVTSCRKSRASK